MNVKPAASAPPASPLSAQDLAALLPPPSLWRRMACWTYEGVLLFGVVFMASLVFTVVSQGVKLLLALLVTPGALSTPPLDLASVGASSSALPSSPERELLQVWILSVVLVYFVFFWTRGQTLAMKTWNLRVTTQSGQALSTQHALARLVLSWVWFWPPLLVALPFEMSLAARSAIGLAWIVFWAAMSLLHPRQQFWHDACAGTELIQTPPLDKDPKDTKESKDTHHRSA